MDRQISQRSDVWRAIGPGIVYAGAAIGVSHLVQSTRAGAEYGFGLVWAVLLVNVCKYPFFEFGQRYAASTGESVLAGYRRLGVWALALYAIVSFLSGMPTVAVVTLVTGGLATQVFTEQVSALHWSAAIMVFCVVVLMAGGYPWLDRLMKLMMVFLAVCTLVAVIAAVAHGSNRVSVGERPDVWSGTGVVFLLALMGWMPTPVDISAWPSLWMEERSKQTGHRPTLREALFDFNLGYISTTVMALLFLSLGALVMYGRVESMPTGAAPFAGKLVQMYTTTLGAWSRPFIVTAAFTCMVSTTITVIDGYPRVLTACVREFRPMSGRTGRWIHWGLMILVTISGWLIIKHFTTQRMRALVDFVTVVAFLSAPMLALLNWGVITRRGLPPEALPPVWMRVLSWVGLAFLLLFAGLYVRTRF